MGSFTTVIDNLATVLTNNSALQAFCQAKWGKSVTVAKAFRQRTEIGLSDLPIILITRPAVEKPYETIGAKEGRHTVRLYCGFYQDKKNNALQEGVEYEEKIEDTVLTNSTLAGTAVYVKPKNSVNDEGEFHPVYFTVMDVEIFHRR